MHAHASQTPIETVLLAWLWCQRGKPAFLGSLPAGLRQIMPDAANAQATIPQSSLALLVEQSLIESIASPTRRGLPKFRITVTGEQRARELLRCPELPRSRTPFKALAAAHLPALALDLPVPEPDKAALSQFKKRLPLAVCARRLNLNLAQPAAAVKLDLVKLALAQQHEVVPAGIALAKLPSGALPALVAAPLLQMKGSTLANLDKLVAARAMQLLGIGNIAQIETGLIRRWLAGDAETKAMPADAAAAPARLHEAFDPTHFVAHVQTATRDAARRGGPGVSNLRDKVLIRFSWERYVELYGQLPLDRYKRLICDANGEGIVLAREDLIPDNRRGDFDESEVRVGASCYHYIRT